MHRVSITQVMAFFLSQNIGIYDECVFLQYWRILTQKIQNVIFPFFQTQLWYFFQSILYICGRDSIDKIGPKIQ